MYNVKLQAATPQEQHNTSVVSSLVGLRNVITTRMTPSPPTILATSYSSLKQDNTPPPHPTALSSFAAS